LSEFLTITGGERNRDEIQSIATMTLPISQYSLIRWISNGLATRKPLLMTEAVYKLTAVFRTADSPSWRMIHAG